MTVRFHLIVLLMAILWQSVFILTTRAIAPRVVELEHVTCHWQNTEPHHDNNTVHDEASDRAFKHFNTGDEPHGAELLDTGSGPSAIVESPSLWDSPVKAFGPTTYLETLLRPPRLLV